MTNQLLDLLQTRTTAARAQAQGLLSGLQRTLDSVLAAEQLAQCPLPIPAELRGGTGALEHEAATAAYVGLVGLQQSIANNRRMMLDESRAELNRVVEARQQAVAQATNAIADAERSHQASLASIDRSASTEVKRAGEVGSMSGVYLIQAIVAGVLCAAWFPITVVIAFVLMILVAIVSLMGTLFDMDAAMDTLSEVVFYGGRGLTGVWAVGALIAAIAAQAKGSGIAGDARSRAASEHEQRDQEHTTRMARLQAAATEAKQQLACAVQALDQLPATS